MIKEWKINKGCLRIPVEQGVNDTRIKIYLDRFLLFDGCIPVSINKVDFWGVIPIEEEKETLLRVVSETENNWHCGIRWEEKERIFHVDNPVFHLTPPSGSFSEVTGMVRELGVWDVEGEYDPFGGEKDRKVKKYISKNRTVIPVESMGESVFCGDVDEQYQLKNGELCMAKSLKFQWTQSACFNMLTPPLYVIHKADGGKYLTGGEELKRLRIWKREWEDLRDINTFRDFLRFRIKPGVWPNIELIPPEGKTDDIFARAFEIRLEAVCEDILELDFCGFKAVYDGKKGVFSVGKYQIPALKERLDLTAYVDVGCAEFICGEKVIFYLNQMKENVQRNVDNSVSGNLDRCRIEESKVPVISMKCNTGTFTIRHLDAYGLKQKENTENYLTQFGIDKDKDQVFYKGKTFSVYNHRVRDDNYGYPEAVAVNEHMVVSPNRVVEEFGWRKTPWGDMNRVVNRSSIWYGRASLDQYPRLESPVVSLNAAYNIAIEIFDLCKNKKFALEGQEGFWSAGMFQGPGEGFGVWLRDSVHVALRCGNLVDPLGAGKTLAFALQRGFDNGSDGPAMGAVGIWDYYLVTGNTDILYEMWPFLMESIREADRRYDSEKELVIAEKSTSNDAFPEPENGGFSLSTECYFMKAYESMVSIAKVIGYKNREIVRKWGEKSRRLRMSIREKYWNPCYGYYTSGPKGTEAFQKGFWETSGEESVLWPRFHIATQKQQESILKELDTVAMTDYGIKLFPFRKEKNHFCGAVLGVWQSGFSAAASRLGNLDLVQKLIAQQIRVCLMNKTFYEVIDSDTGKAWRWPGQLWNAAGFISLIMYGVFGLEYNEEGMYFHPAVPQNLENICLNTLPFRKMVLDIQVCGWGSNLECMDIDGQRRGFVEGTLEGHHRVILYMHEN